MSEAAKWQERYQRPQFWAGSEPAPFLREALPLLPGVGTALEVASGEGRNAVFLAEQGWRVTAVDLAPAGFDKADLLAAQRGVRAWRWAAGLPFTPDAPGVLLLQADLEREPLPDSQFGLVVCTNFLLRPLLPKLEQTLLPGGCLIYETYTTEQLRFEGGPRNPEYLLRPGELRAAFPGLRTLFYRECSAGKGIASLLAHKPAASPASCGH